MWNLSKRAHGFSLIELMIAIGLMAILSAATISLIGPGPRQSSRDARRWADLEKIASAMELYRADQGGYPTSTNYSCSGGIPCLTTTYLSALPTDPLPPRVYTYTPSGCVTNCTSFVLCSDLEKVTGAGCDARVTNP